MGIEQHPLNWLALELLAAIAIRMDSPGPVLFRQGRVCCAVIPKKHARGFLLQAIFPELGADSLVNQGRGLQRAIRALLIPRRQPEP